ncbi:MAG: glucose-1-phosphate thymidylyltransferase RfbA [bacterium]|nr:glucose-1-phosphate thymidylyltransferase RfbA [bacterium]
MKGVILAGGAGTRLYPLTTVTSKQLMPVYDKPMIYYPLSVLMLAGINEILVISTPHDLPRFRDLFRDGSSLGLKISYKEQPRPEGIAQAFIIAESFLGRDSVCLILGDNLFYGQGFGSVLMRLSELKKGAVIFGYGVKEPQHYGVVEFDKKGNVLSIEEKPKQPRSHYAVPGLYFFDNEVTGVVKGLNPSARGELEITDVISQYLKKGLLKMELMGRGYAWLDTGTHDSLLEASNFISTIENRQGLKVGCIEEVAYRKGFISRDELTKLVKAIPENSYRQYLEQILADD